MIQTSSIPVPDTDPPCGLHDVARQLRHVLCAALLLLLFGALPAGAIGPETPVDFLDVYAAKGFMLLVIEPEQITNLGVMRIIHQAASPCGAKKSSGSGCGCSITPRPSLARTTFSIAIRANTESPGSTLNPSPVSCRQSIRRSRCQMCVSQAPVVASDAPPDRMGVLIPLESKAQRELKDGAYAEKFIARARLVGESATGKPLTMVRWSHFVMRDQRPRFISQAEYSRTLDPPTDGVDGSGGKIELNLGRDVKADVPIEKTSPNQAVPLGQLGRHGGLTPERDERRYRSGLVSPFGVVEKLARGTYVGIYSRDMGIKALESCGGGRHI